MNIKELESKLINCYGDHENTNVREVVIKYIGEAYRIEDIENIFNSLIKNRPSFMGFPDVSEIEDLYQSGKLNANKDKNSEWV